MRRILLILPFLTILYSCGTSTKTDNLTSSQLELFNYLPDNTDYLFYADLREINRSRYGREDFISSLPVKMGEDWIKKYEKATGTVIKQGINEIIIAGTRNNNNILLVRFNKDYNKVLKYFSGSSDFQQSSLKGIFSFKKKPGVKLYMPGADIMVICRKGEYIDSLAKGRIKNLTTNKRFLTTINNIREKNILWMATDKGSFAAGIFDRLAGKDSKLLSPEILSSIRNFSVSADFSSGAEIESVMGCSSAGNAYLLAAAVQGAVAMNILSQKNYKLGKIFDKLVVNRDGKLIRFHLDLEEKELDELKQLTLNDKKGNNSEGEIW